MHALRVHAFGELPRLEDIADPEPAEGELLVRLEASVIGHHDLGVAAGTLPLAQPLPYVPGMEGAGRLEDGTLVRVLGGGLGMTRQGAWAEMVAAPAAAVTRVPQSMAPELAAACGSPAFTAWVALHGLGRVQDGESVGVTGASGVVGSLVAQLAGDRELVRYSRAQAADPAAGPVDLLIDTVGGPDLPRRLRSVKPGGRAVLVGYTAGERVELDLPALMHRDVSLLPMNMQRRRVSAEVASQLLEDFAAGALKVKVNTVKPEAVGDAIEQLRAGDLAGRLVVTWPRR